MKLFLPFSKGKFIDLSLKKVDTLYSLNNHQPIGLDIVSGDTFGSKQQNEQDLIDDGYGSNVTVYSIIKDIATSGADIPKVLLDVSGEEAEEIESGELYDVLQNPARFLGEDLTQFAYFEALITMLLASGNTYQRGIEAVGFGDTWQQMELIPSGIVTPITANSYFDGIAAYQIDDKAAQFNVTPEEILHTKYINPTTFGLDDGEGLSPLQAAIFSLTGSSDIQKAISIMVKNQGIRGIISSGSDRVMTKEEGESLQRRFDKDNLGTKNFAKLNITSATIDYTQLGMTADQLKVIESGVLTDRQLCNAFGVSSRLYNDPANSTFNNMKEANKSFYTKAVIPTLNKLLMDINNGWLKQWSERDGKDYELTLDISGIEALQSDQLDEATKDKTQLEGVQIILNLPISEDGKKELLKKTYKFDEDYANLVVTNSGTNEFGE